MLAIFFVSSILILCIDIHRYRNICSPTVVFCCLWIVIVALASLGLFGFSGYTNKALLSVTCGVIGFGLGGLIMTRLLDRRARDVGRGEKACTQLEGGRAGGACVINARLLYLILCLVCVGEALSLISTLQALSQGANYVQVRGAQLGYSDGQAINTNQLLLTYQTYFCGPALTALVPIAVTNWFERKRPKFCIAVLLCLVASVVASGGRIALIYAIGQLVVALVFYGNQITRRTKRVLLIVVGFAAFGVIALTFLRSSTSLLYSVYSYLTVPMGLLSHFIEVVDEAGFHSFGASFLYPFFYLANAATRLLGMGSSFLGDLVYYVALPQETWVQGLFPERVYNAFATMFYYLYLDFGTIGIPILTGLFGAFLTFVFRKTFLKNSRAAFLWYLLLFRTLLGSFMIWQLGNTKFFLSMFIFAAILFPTYKRGHIGGMKRQNKIGGVPTPGLIENEQSLVNDNKQLLVNVVIPVYNVRDYLAKCVNSVLMQTHENIRVWLVDDGSTDGSSILCDEYAGKDARVRVIHKVNGGLSSARNEGLDQIFSIKVEERGSFVSFVDSDDWVEPDFISFLLNLLTATDADISQCGHFISFSEFSESEKCADHSLSVLNREQVMESLCRNGRWDVTAWNKMYRLSLFEDLRYPVGKSYEDTATAHLIAEKANKFTVSMVPLYHYVQRYTSIANGVRWSDSKLDLIEAGDQMAEWVSSHYPALRDAAIEKRVFVRLSTLSQMVNTGRCNDARAQEMRLFVCDHAGLVLRDRGASKRDKLGVLMLLPGLFWYRLVWSMYYSLRRRRAIWR